MSTTRCQAWATASLLAFTTGCSVGAPDHVPLVQADGGGPASGEPDASSPADAPVPPLPDAGVGQSGAPGSINDLRVLQIGSDRVTLAFTEVDDGTHHPAEYDVRFSAPRIM